MPLEDLTGPNKYIDDLVREWPLGIDPFSEGDDHLRGLKNVLKNSFPSVAEDRRPVSYREGDTLSEELASAIALAVGTAAQRPSSPSQYDLRVNSETGALEWWTGAEWVPAVAMLREDNVRVGAPNAQSSPIDQWSANRAPQAGDLGPTLSFNTGDGPGNINMGALRWQISPDDPTRMRLALRRNNEGLGNPLVIGAGVMVPEVDNPPDSFDPGLGSINVSGKYLVNGLPAVDVWESEEIPWINNTQRRYATSRTRRPDIARLIWRCTSADLNYAPGDEVEMGGSHDATISGTNNQSYNTVFVDNATEVGLVLGNRLMLTSKDGSQSGAQVNYSSWNAVLRAFWFG